MTDGRTDGRTDGGDCNIPNAFLKKRGDNYPACKALKPNQQTLGVSQFLYQLFSLEKKGILILYQSQSIVRLFIRHVSCKCITS